MIVGIVGGGQLARMLALAGYPLGLRCLVLDPSPDACAGQVAELVRGDYDDPDQLSRLAERADCVTFEFENVPGEAVRFLEQRVPTYPKANALCTAQDRLAEKRLFQELDIPTPIFETVDSLHGLHLAVNQTGLPAVLKTRRLGYDGKGQRVLRNRQDLEHAWEMLGGVPLTLEGFVPFEKEVSVISVRNRKGETAFYPLVENRHDSGILHLSIAPCPDADLEHKARAYAMRLLERLDYVGVLAVEFFVLDGQLMANEIAPRVHNSGHWTVEGAETSQFENHLRAILGLPLGATASRGHAAMVNCIGELPERDAVLALPGAHFHGYGKSPKPGRKIGHITLRTDDRAILQARLDELSRLVDF